MAIFDYNHQRRLQRSEITAQFKVTHNFDRYTRLDQCSEAIDSAFESAVLPLIGNYSPDDRVSFKINSKHLTEPIYLSPVAVKNFDKKSFLNKLLTVSQSNKEFLLAQELTIQVNRWIVVNGRPKGSGKMRM